MKRFWIFYLKKKKNKNKCHKIDSNSSSRIFVMILHIFAFEGQMFKNISDIFVKCNYCICAIIQNDGYYR